MDIRPAIYDPDREAADRLRDAAPDLLKACELALLALTGKFVNELEVNAIHHLSGAIRKAKGITA